MNRYRSLIETSLRVWLLVVVFLVMVGQVSLNKDNPTEEALSPPCFRFDLEQLKGVRFSAGGKLENLLYVGAGLYLLALCCGCSVRPRWSLIYISFGIMLVIFALACLLSPLRALSWDSGLKHLLTQAGIFFLISVAFREERYRKILLLVMISGLSLSALGGLILYKQGVYFPQTDHRVWLSFGHPNSTGSVLVLVLPIMIAWAIIQRRVRILLGAAIVLSFFIMFLTYSRTAWLSLLFALAILTWLMLRPRYRVVFLLILAGMGALLIWGVNVGPQKYWKQRIKTFASLKDDPNIKNRIVYWESARNMIEKRPILGWGPGYLVFIQIYRHHFKQVETHELVTAPHNGFLSIGVGSGLAGLAAFLALMLTTLLFLFRGRKNPQPFEKALAIGILAGLLGFLLGNMTDDPLLNERVGALFYIILGLVAGAVRIDGGELTPYNSTLYRNPKKVENG